MSNSWTEVRLADALKGARAGVWEWDIRTDLVTWSPEMFDLIGIGVDNAPTRELFFERVHPGDRAALYLATVHAVDVSSEINVEVRMTNPAGTRWVSIQAQVVREAGVAVRVIGLVQDITQRRKAEERYERLANLVPCIVWTSDPSGRTRYVNPRLTEVTGLVFDPDGPGPWQDITHPDDLERTRIRWRQAIKEALPYEAEVRYRTTNGDYRWYLERAEPIRDDDGAVVEWFGTSVDVHDRTVADQETRDLLDSMPQIAWGVGADNQVDYLNQRYLDYCGLGPDARGEKGWRDVVHPEDRNFSEEYRRCVSEGRTWTRELRLRRFDGVYRWHLSRLTPVYEEGGRVMRWFGTSTDIHEQKTKEEALAFLVRLTEVTRNEVDPDQIMSSTVRLLGEHLGASRCACAEVDADESSFTVVHDWAPGLSSVRGVYRFADFGQRIWSDLRRGKTLVLNDAARGRGPEEGQATIAALGIRAEIVCPLIKEGRIAMMIGVYSAEPREWTSDEAELVEMVADRSWANMERARSERELRELNLDLERRIAERTRELVEANREMEGFTYTVSHDLRSPLRAISATSMILVEEASHKLSAAEIALLQRQAHNAKRLGVLIDELLKLSRLSREEVRPSSFDISSLTLEVVSELVADGRATDIKFEVEPDMTARGDEKLVRFVLMNLIENACKFSRRKDGQIGTVRVGGRGDAYFVADEGIGFDPRYVERLFRPFERLVTEAEFPGTGIGLANVKRIVERHGGTVWAESEPGHGATFWFTLGEPGERA